MFGGAEIMLILPLLIFISIIGIGIFIQVKLSRSENKYLGLILPVISFLLSIYIIFSMAAFTLMTSTSTTSDSGVDEGVEDTIEEPTEVTEEVVKEEVTSDVVLGMFFTFLITNIPTAILGGIYINERNKISVKKSIDKMKIDDL
ncbi:MAG: hypothetical protein ACTHW2_08435 [Tissierella sp.]|uniref:hypothetical protein n=1 Tax=Tissierella sp. TaxID=41274 RepID=UPI003F94738E